MNLRSGGGGSRHNREVDIPVVTGDEGQVSRGGGGAGAVALSNGKKLEFQIKSGGKKDNNVDEADRGVIDEGSEEMEEESFRGDELEIERTKISDQDSPPFLPSAMAIKLEGAQIRLNAAAAYTPSAPSIVNIAATISSPSFSSSPPSSIMHSKFAVDIASLKSSLRESVVSSALGAIAANNTSRHFFSTSKQAALLIASLADQRAHYQAVAHALSIRHHEVLRCHAEQQWRASYENSGKPNLLSPPYY